MLARVHRQILAGQLPFLFLFLIFFAILLWFSHRCENALLSTHLETARRSSQVVVYAVQASMLSERSHAVWDHAVEKIPREADTDIEIVDARGRTLFSTDPLLMNRQRNLGDPLCAECHRKLEMRHFRVLAQPERSELTPSPVHRTRSGEAG